MGKERLKVRSSGVEMRLKPKLDIYSIRQLKLTAIDLLTIEFPFALANGQIIKQKMALATLMGSHAAEAEGI